MNQQLMHPADLLVSYMERIYRYGMTTTSGGNLSVLDENGDMWITPAGTDKGTMKREDIVCVKKDGTILGRHKPSSEYPFHLKIYQTDNRIRAVLHAHAPALIAFSTVRRLPDLTLLPAVAKTCGTVRMAPYAMTGSEQLGEVIAAQFQKGCDIAILENHGLVAAGETMQQAFLKFEALEFGATIEMNARQIGKTCPLTKKQLEQRGYAHVWQDSLQEHHTVEEIEARNQLCSFLRRAYCQKLTCGAFGSASVRLNDGSFVMTPAKADRYELEPEQCVRILNQETEPGKQPDEYARLHQEIYRTHPDAGAVLIAQPPHLMAFAVTKNNLNTRLIPESYMVLQDITRIEAGEEGHDPTEIAGRMSQEETVVLLENEAAVAVGKNLLQAFDRLEVAQSSAKALINAGHLGNIVEISEKEIQQLRDKFQIR
jgi:L-fuculose-phosphate aldolase